MKNKNNQQERKRLYPESVSNENETSSIQLEDPCAAKEKPPSPITFKTPGLDPRFQQQNQTTRCYVMYVDFFNCQHLLGEGHEACTWFQDVYKSICPNAWIERWDEWRSENRMPWRKNGPFGEAPYGK